VIYRKTPNPLGEGDLYLYAPPDLESTLAAAADGAPVSRAVLAADAAPEENDVRALERQLRQAWTGRARRAFGWAMWWLLAGPALSLLWAKVAEPVSGVLLLPALKRFGATLGASSGGPVLAAAVFLAPWIWSWARGVRDLADARRFRRLAKAAASRRLREAPLRRETDPALAAFSTEAEPLRARLRTGAAAIGERGADGAGEAADAARQLALLAARHGLAEVSQVYAAVYNRFGASERRLARSERGGAGVMAERRASGEAKRVQKEVRRLLARYRPGFRPPSSPLAPALGVLAGVVVLAASVAGTGLYVVDRSGAMLLEPVGLRAARAMGLANAQESVPEVVQGPATGWAPPYPLTGRRYVSFEPQPILISARFHRVAADRWDVIQIGTAFRISNVEQWARFDADGHGADRLPLLLSTAFEEYVRSNQQQAAQFVVSQNPALANNPQQAMQRADQLLEQQLDGFTRYFVTNVAPDSVQQFGIQLASESQSRIVRGVPDEVANTLLGE